MARLSVLTHTHTPPARNTLIPSLHCALTPRLFSFLTVCSHPRTGLPGLTHTDIHSLHDSAETLVHSNLHPLCCCSSAHKLGADHPHAGTIVCLLPSRTGDCPFHAQFGSRYLLFLCVVYKCITGDFVAQGRAVVFPCCELCSLISFRAVVFPML